MRHAPKRGRLQLGAYCAVSPRRKLTNPKTEPQARKEQSFLARVVFTQHFENFAKLGEINFEDFALFVGKNFEERNNVRITNERYLIYTKDYAHEESVKYLPAYLA